MYDLLVGNKLYALNTTIGWGGEDIAVVRGGHAVVRGGHADVRGGHAVVRGGHADVRGGHAVVRGGHCSCEVNIFPLLGSFLSL